MIGKCRCLKNNFDINLKVQYFLSMFTHIRNDWDLLRFLLVCTEYFSIQSHNNYVTLSTRHVNINLIMVDSITIPLLDLFFFTNVKIISIVSMVKRWRVRKFCLVKIQRVHQWSNGWTTQLKIIFKDTIGCRVGAKSLQHGPLILHHKVRRCSLTFAQKFFDTVNFNNFALQ